MALFTFNFESQYLHGNTEIAVIMPDKPRATDPKTFYLSGRKYKVLWLLHGGMGDYSDWVRKSNIELYACENDLVVVMPSALNSSYTNWPGFANGYAMNDYFFEELMPMIYGWLPVSDKREDNYIAGLSMGGTGTFKFMLTHPEKFTAAAVLSSAPEDYLSMTKEQLAGSAKFANRISNAGGIDELLASDDHTWRLFHEKKNADLPRIYMAIGDKDHGFARFTHFKEEAEKIGFPVKFEIVPGFEHEWRVWEITIQRALAFFGFTSREGGNAY